MWTCPIPVDDRPITDCYRNRRFQLAAISSPASDVGIGEALPGYVVERVRAGAGSTAESGRRQR
jgi:hypothetical protein